MVKTCLHSNRVEGVNPVQGSLIRGLGLGWKVKYGDGAGPGGMGFKRREWRASTQKPKPLTLSRDEIRERRLKAEQPT